MTKGLAIRNGDSRELVDSHVGNCNDVARYRLDRTRIQICNSITGSHSLIVGSVGLSKHSFIFWAKRTARIRVWRWRRRRGRREGRRGRRRNKAACSSVNGGLVTHASVPVLVGVDDHPALLGGNSSIVSKVEVSALSGYSSLQLLAAGDVRAARPGVGRIPNGGCVLGLEVSAGNLAVRVGGYLLVPCRRAAGHDVGLRSGRDEVVVLGSKLLRNALGRTGNPSTRRLRVS